MFLGFTSMNTLNDPRPEVLAPLLEEAGFESLWYGEHSHIPMCRTTAYPLGGELPHAYKEMLDPYISLMAAASVTSSLKLGTGVALVLEREFFSQAKTICTLDQFSGGRLIVGAGIGWNQEEFENTTTKPFNRRYRILKETIAAQRELFTSSAPEYHGEFIDFDPVWFEPKPFQSGGPKILLGANGPQGVKHAAQWADGWMPVDIALPDLKKNLKKFRQWLKEFGRNPDDIEITLVAMNDLSVDLLKRYRDLGVTRTNIGIGMQNWDKPELIIPMIESYAPLISELA